jgi:hypothetical protein
MTVVPIALMLATLTDCRDFGEDWRLGVRDDKRPTDIVRERPE